LLQLKRYYNKPFFMVALQIDKNFEKQKNIKSLAITIFICLGLLLLFVLKTWTLPQIIQPIIDEGIEVNLGNSNDGLGNIEPQSTENGASVSQPENAVASPPQPTENNEPNDNGDVATSAIAKPKTTITSTETKPTTKPIIAKPKAVFGGAKNNTTGNNSNTNNSFSNQGITKGPNNAGSLQGSTNSDSYVGLGGVGGLTIKKGLKGRKFLSVPSFEDDFNENAKVAVDIIVDVTGKVTNAQINLNGTSTTNASIRQIAKNKALQVKFNTSSEEQLGTIVFDFKVTN
jgi:hypothetical protein